MRVWQPLQYRRVWDEFYAGCDSDTKITLDYRLDFLLERGSSARKPASNPLEDGIFELRAKDARCLYYFGVERRTIVFVHAIHKKRMDVPVRDINLAKRRREQIESGTEALNELT